MGHSGTVYPPRNANLGHARYLPDAEEKSIHSNISTVIPYFYDKNCNYMYFDV